MMVVIGLVLAFIVGLIMMVIIERKLIKLIGVVVYFVGIALISVGLNNSMAEAAKSKEEIKEQNEIKVVEHMKEVTGANDVEVKTSKLNNQYVLKIGEDIYEVELVDDIIIYDLKDNVIKVKSE